MTKYIFQYDGAGDDHRQFPEDADAMIAARYGLQLLRRITHVKQVNLWAKCSNGKYRLVASYK